MTAGRRTRGERDERRRETFIRLEPAAISGKIVQPARKRHVVLKLAVAMAAACVVAAGLYAAVNWQAVLTWFPGA